MLNEGDITNHIENLKPGIYAVLDSVKDRLRSEIRTFKLAEVNWKFVPKDIRIAMYKQLEKFGNEEVPLGVCVSHWGAQLILANSSYEDSSCSSDSEEKGNVAEIEKPNNENESSNGSEESGNEITMDVLSSLRRVCDDGIDDDMNCK
ncbi:hypothetical protein G6F56_008945 [Rhizopus delemar]|nr:hypothetical protein G6F56_008945 [Rhizopus delemar]